MDPATRADLADAWTADARGPRAIVVERGADLGGVSVRVPALTSAAGLRLVASAPGLDLDVRPDREGLRGLLRDVRAALARDPLAPARLRLEVAGRLGRGTPGPR